MKRLSKKATRQRTGNQRTARSSTRKQSPDRNEALALYKHAVRDATLAEDALASGDCTWAAHLAADVTKSAALAFQEDRRGEKSLDNRQRGELFDLDNKATKLLDAAMACARKPRPQD